LKRAAQSIQRAEVKRANLHARRTMMRRPAHRRTAVTPTACWQSFATTMFPANRPGALSKGLASTK